MGIISGHQLSTFSTPVNGTTPIDANTVRGNDNTIKTSYNAHDADATIHLQSGAASARPSQGTAGQTWLATDSGGVFLSIDNGTAWVDINYIRTTATSLPANVLASSLTSVGVLAAPHMTAPVIDSGGMTISSGTLAAQAVTATSVTAGTASYRSGTTTASVSNVATTIFSNALGGSVALFVQGSDGAGNQFQDLVFQSNGVNPTAPISSTIQGSPTVRTYSFSAGNLKLAMASGTYTIKTAPLEIA